MEKKDYPEAITMMNGVIDGSKKENYSSKIIRMDDIRKKYVSEDESRDLALDNIANRSKKSVKKNGNFVKIKKAAFIAGMVGASIISVGTLWYGNIVKETMKDIDNSKCLETEYKGIPLNEIITTPTSRGVTVYIDGVEDDIDAVINTMNSVLLKTGYTENQAAICEENYLGVDVDHSIIGVVQDYYDMKEKGEMFDSGMRFKEDNPKGRK